MSRGWVEIWTRPGSATFEAVIVDPPIQSASFTRTLSGIGRGELVLPADYDRVDEIILTDLATPANNVRTLVRVFLDDGTATPVVAYEFYADQLERVEGPDNLISITGPGVESAMGDARVEPYDWDGSANFVSEFPDWVFGGRDVLGTQPLTGLEFIYDVFQVYSDATGGTFTLTLNGNTSAALTFNAQGSDIEDELQVTPGVDVYVEGAGVPSTDTESIYYVWSDATGGTFTLSSGGDTTGNIAYNAAAATIETALEGLSSVTSVTVLGAGTEASPYFILFINPADGDLTGNGAGLTGATDGLSIDRPVGGPWRITVYSPDDGNTMTGNGASLTGGSVGLVVDQVQEAGYNAETINGWTVAQFADRSTSPQLFGTYGTPPLSVTTTSLPAGTTWGLNVNGTSQFAGAQKVINVTPGGRYHARIAFRTTVATDPFRWVIRDPSSDGQNPPLYAFPSAGGGQTIPANTLVLWDIDDITIPDGLSQIIDRLAYVGVGDPATFTIFPELSYFREGKPPTTFGDIFIQLMEDADGTDHPAREVWRDAADSFTWVDYSSFTDVLDSNGDAWQDAELSVTIKRGKPYDKVLADFVGLGYEWELIPDTSTPGVWSLNLYNSDGIGTDRTALNTPQIFGEESVGGARMYRRHPPASNVAVEGSSQLSARISSVGAVTAYGLRETYVPDLDITTLADAGLKATQTISAYLRKSQPLTLARQPRDVDPFPFIAFQLGDTVNVSEPPFMEKDGRRLVQVVWALTAEGETVAESYGAVTYTGQAAVNQGVFQLLDRFEPIREVDGFRPVTAGGGGVIPWLVAAVDSPDVWKAAAAYLCTGISDQDTINAAIAVAEGFVGLAPGNYSCTTSTSAPSVNLGLGSTSGCHVFGFGGEFAAQIFQSDSGVTTPGPLIELADECHLENVSVFTVDTPAIRCDSIVIGRVDRCHVEAAGGAAVLIESSTSVRVEDSYLFSDGWVVDCDTSSRLIVARNEFAVDDQAVRLVSCTDYQVENNLIGGVGL